jgi:hypothetical protein
MPKGQTDRGFELRSPTERYSRIVRFVNEADQAAAAEAPTSVDIFAAGGHWYCQVCRGETRTRPMGPYTRAEAERIQDMRGFIISKKGTSQLIFN